MRVALTGGTGFVGQTLIDCAVEQGVPVRALARRPQAARDGVAWQGGDLADRTALAGLVGGAEAVIHVAGVVSAPDAAAFEEGNVRGTRNLIEAAKDAGVRRFLFVSSLSAREPGLSQYGASKHRAEALVRDSGLDWTIIRPPAIYGPRDREMFELFRSAKWGVVPAPAEGKLSVIHVGDLASLLLALVPGGDGVSHRSFEPDDGKPGGWHHDAFARAIGVAVGRRVRVLGLTPRTLHRAARLDMALRRKRAKMTLDRAGYFSHPDWVVTQGSHVPQEIWRPRIETREGLKATALWYREQGWL